MLKLHRVGIRVPAYKYGLPAHYPEEIINFGIWELKKGKSENTIIPDLRNLTMLSKKCNLTDIEQVKTTIALMNVKNSTKLKLCYQYGAYLKFKELKWEQPKYKAEDTLPFIPTESEIDILIASCRHKLATLLQLLKETGMRIGEAQLLKWTDINLQNKTVNITPEKGSNPRILPLTDKLTAMLNEYPHTKEHIFPKRQNHIRSVFDSQRQRTANKLKNPRLLKIGFHTLRHFKGTMEYHITKDIMHVKYILGHKEITTTMLYINLEQATFTADTEQWITKVSHNEKEELQLIEANFTLVRATNETTAIYKKRK